MTRTVYCTSCGATRTIDTVRPMRAAPGVAGGGVVACFKCGETEFTTDPTNAPAFVPLWLITQFDRDLLRQGGIARGSLPVQVSRR